MKLETVLILMLFVAVTSAKPSKTIMLQPKGNNCAVDPGLATKPSKIEITAHSYEDSVYSDCTNKCSDDGALPYPTHKYTVANSITYELRKKLLEEYGKEIPTRNNLYHMNGFRIQATDQIKVADDKIVNKDDAKFGWHSNVNPVLGQATFNLANMVAASLHISDDDDNFKVDLDSVNTLAKCLCEKVTD